jgi:hypothetical protein
MPHSIISLFGLLFLVGGTVPLWAGNYDQNFNGHSSGTTDLGDGSEIASNNAVAQVRGSGNPYLRLTSNRTGGTSSSFKLPDLDPGDAMESFTATFEFQVGGTGVLADGAALSFGAIPAGNGAGEGGFASANGLVISWDTFANADEDPSIEFFQTESVCLTSSSISPRWPISGLRWH